MLFTLLHFDLFFQLLVLCALATLSQAHIVYQTPYYGSGGVSRQYRTQDVSTFR